MPPTFKKKKKKYLAYRLSEAGQPIESALDHTYTSNDLRTKLKVSKLETSSTDCKVA